MVFAFADTVCGCVASDMLPEKVLNLRGAKGATMKQSRFSQEQILDILKQQEVGRTVADVCREHGLNQATFYSWKRPEGTRFGGMSVSDAQRLRQLETENAKLRRVVADLTLDNVALKDVLPEKW